MFWMHWWMRKDLNSSFEWHSSLRERARFELKSLNVSTSRIEARNQSRNALSASVLSVKIFNDLRQSSRSTKISKIFISTTMRMNILSNIYRIRLISFKIFFDGWDLYLIQDANLSFFWDFQSHANSSRRISKMFSKRHWHDDCKYWKKTKFTTRRSAVNKEIWEKEWDTAKLQALRLWYRKRVERSDKSS